MIRASTCILVFIAALAAIAPAAAQTDQAVIAVLPLGADSERMGIYSTPVAGAVADRLRSQHGFHIEAVSLSGALPARVDLVVDGRIVAGQAGKIVLQARVRDPARGTTVAAVTTGERALAEIDRLAAELAAALAPQLRAAMDARSRQAAVESRVPRTARPASQTAGQTTGQSTNQTAGQHAGQTPAQTSPGGAASSRAPARAGSSHMVVFGAKGQAAGGSISVDAVATRAGYQLATRLGFTPLASKESGLVPPATVQATLRETGAAHALMILVDDVSFSWTGVLTARGRARIILVDTRGLAIYDRVLRTGTLVGSRGDTHAALVRFVMAQIVDIAAPEIRRALAALQPMARASTPAGKP